MAGDTSRINGQKGGRPKGSENLAAKTRREMQKRWIERVWKNADKIFDAHLALALGYWVTVTHPMTGEIIDVAQIKPNAASLEWIMEHIWGRAPQTIEPDNEVQDDLFLTPATQAALAAAMHHAIPKENWNEA